MRYEQILATVVIALLAGTISAYLILTGNSPGSASGIRVDTALERMSKSGKLKCGYIEVAPYFAKDPNTGALSGMWYELTEKLGASANVQIIWAAATTHATLAADLKAKKFDAFCTGIWATTANAKDLIFSAPVHYSELSVYVGGDEQRFSGNLDELNKANIKFATIDGETSQLVRQEVFPESAALLLPATADNAQLAESVASQKADAVITIDAVINSYLKNNPGKLKQLALDQPLRTFEDSYATLPDDTGLRDFLSVGIKELQTSGFVEKTLKKYETVAGEFNRVQPGYAK